MSIRRNPGVELLLCFRWHVANGELTPVAIEKLGPYITRYAATLNVLVHAVGGVSDHLHILADIPSDMPADRVTKELHMPTARYLKDVLGVRSFAWNADTVAIVSVATQDRESIMSYLATQEEIHTTGELDFLLEVTEEVSVDVPVSTEEELPGWLKNALR